MFRKYICIERKRIDSSMIIMRKIVRLNEMK